MQQYYRIFQIVKEERKMYNFSYNLWYIHDFTKLYLQSSLVLSYNALLLLHYDSR